MTDTQKKFADAYITGATFIAGLTLVGIALCALVMATNALEHVGVRPCAYFIVIGAFLGGLIAAMAAPSIDEGPWRQVAKLQQQVAELQATVLTAQSEAITRQGRIHELETERKHTIEMFGGDTGKLGSSAPLFNFFSGVKSVLYHIKKNRDELEAALKPLLASVEQQKFTDVGGGTALTLKVKVHEVLAAREALK